MNEPQTHLQKLNLLRRTPLLAGLLVMILIGGCSTAPPEVVFKLGTVHRNLTYCNSQKLDLYIPRSAAIRPLPIALYVHGGGMTAGDKSNLNPLFLNALASAGYAVASIDYRLAPQFRYPAQIQDVKCAIRYLRAKAPLFGLDSRDVFAFGTSAGGQLVALAALTGSHSMFDVGQYPREASSVTAAVDMFGPANLTQRSSGYSPSDLEQVFVRTDRHDLLLGSPTHFVARNSPPILLVQGVEDTTVDESQSIELDKDLKAAGDHPQLVLVQNMGHMFVQVGPKELKPNHQEIARDLVSFFDGERRS